MSDEDIDYFRRRAVDERERARISAGRQIADIHLALARQYEALAESQVVRPQPADGQRNGCGNGSSIHACCMAKW